MKKAALVLLTLMSSGIASASECTVSIDLNYMFEDGMDKTTVQNIAQQELEAKGYTIADSSSAIYTLTIGSIEYCYGKKGPPKWDVPSGYDLSFSKGKPDYKNKTNLIVDKEIQSSVLFGVDFAAKKLKKAIHNLPVCAEIGR